MEEIEEIAPEQAQEEAIAVPAIVIDADTINSIIQSKNLAEKMKAKDLDSLGYTVVEEYELDAKSREDWIKAMKEATDLARQLFESKTDSTGSIVSNIKLPIIASAIIQFSARAYPNIVKGRNVVKGKVIGRDDGRKAARAGRISSYMNTQILDLMEDWEGETDLLLTLLALNGCMFRKTYWCSSSKSAKSDLVLPEDMVVHFYAKSFEPRATHVLYLSKNEIESRVRAGEFIKHESSAEALSDEEAEKKARSFEDTERGICYLEQHRWWDLDEDGFDEPCIVTVHYGSGKVVRVVPRFDINGVSFDDEGKKITAIKPVRYFVKYPFMRSLDGSFYETGFGTLLSPICRAANTTVNQLVDAGTAANNGGGFIGRGLRLGKSGTVRFKRDEYHLVPSTGDDIRRSVFPFPFKPPSNVLFQLLGLMMDQSEKLSSMSDLMAGQNPPKDQPATTTLALIEQGLKVFGAVFKRVFLALKTEFGMIYRLNRMYLSEEDYMNILDDPEATKADWEGDSRDIVPVSDEAELTDIQRSLKAQMLLGMRQPYNQVEIERRFYEAMGIEDWQKLLPPEDWQPPPDPEIEIKKQELQLKAKELEIKEAETMMILVERRNRALSLWADSVESLAKAQATEDGAKAKNLQAIMDAARFEMDIYDRAVGGFNGKGGAIGREQGSVPLLEEARPDNGGGYASPEEGAGFAPQSGGGFGVQPGIDGTNGAILGADQGQY